LEVKLMNSGKKYEFVIIGAGAGGATVARELVRRGKQVLVIEKGLVGRNLGSSIGVSGYFHHDRFTRMPVKSKEGVMLWHAYGAGGSTVFSCGNGVPCLEAELAEAGVSLKNELAEVNKELNISPYDERRLSAASKIIKEVSGELGFDFVPMPKFIDAKKCRRCGNCQVGCAYDAKWTAKTFLDEAIAAGAEVMYGTSVDKILGKNGTVSGVSIKGPGGRAEVAANVVVLAAGGIDTPVVLQNSGFADAGKDFFIDQVVDTYGISRDLSQLQEPTMALVNHQFHKEEGFILSPFMQQSRLARFIELGTKGFFMSADRMLGIMTKIIDEPGGRVFPDGTFSKTVTPRDRKRLDRGSSISKEILIKAGVDEKSIVVSRVQGGHPGGTAAIGKIVDKDLQTSMANLFVCDASVLPAAPGLPPIMTIVALGKRLAATLAA
jgi:choline dehydrogenase-like flavoprotein